MNFRVLKTYIYSVHKRVLPNVKYNHLHFSHLYSDKRILSYFKGIRNFNEYPELYEMFKKRGFNMSLADKVRKTRLRTKEIFFENLESLIHLSSSPKTKFDVNISLNMLDFLSYRFKIDLFPKGYFPVFDVPSLDQVISAVNKTASSGLPYPYIKKRDFLSDFTEMFYGIKDKTISLSKLFSYPAAAFLRFQIKSSDLKVRVVNAVEKYLAFYESFFYIWFMNGYKKIQDKSSLCIGLTQLQVSEISSSYKDYNTYSIDYKKWDLKRPQIISIISFCILEECMPLSNYYKTMLRSLRNYYLTMPIFHPNYTLVRRHRGTISGSGFTTLDNSICNWIITTFLVFLYCRKVGINPYKTVYKLNILGDDLLIGFRDHTIDFRLFASIVKREFNMDIELEMFSPKGKNVCFFLGSRWENGVPYREEKHMVASVIFGSANFPKMSKNILLQSRFFEIFGNSGDCGKYWSRFNFPIAKRIFFFNELSNPHRFGRGIRENYHDSLSKRDRRGHWFNNKTDRHTINSLWRER